MKFGCRSDCANFFGHLKPLRRFTKLAFSILVAPCLTRGLAFHLGKTMTYDHMEKSGWVYIMANRYRGGMYVGVTARA